ncbi:MAG: universal stress protein [Arcobacteraceae bacterium]|nr:universal stress protein [Arcobacteraceae bacterium]MDY0326737.1 universal stress protein [Arcobacteraceae bacterium]
MLSYDKAIFACVDGSKFSTSVVDYGVEVAKTLNLPLKLLNTVEHSHKSSKVDLSGNMSLGERDDLLETLSKEDEVESKCLISQGKDILAQLKSRAISAGVENIITAQRHGTLYENLIELQDKIRLLIIGLRGQNHDGQNHTIGEQIEEILRTIDVPTLLVNGEFTPVKSVLMAYDGSPSSIKALQSIVKSPTLGNDIKRYVVNVCNDERKSQLLLAQAKMIMEDSNMEVEFVSLKGDPLNELLKFQEENNIDMLAMGAFSHGKLRNALFGSFTAKILANSQKPVVLIR